MMKSLTLIIILSVTILVSCQKKKGKLDSAVSGTISQKIELLDTLKSYALNQGFIQRPRLDKKLKIVAFIDGTCSTCVYQLRKWQLLMEDLKSANVNFIFYVRAPNIENVSELMKEINFTYPIIYDPSNSFFKTNAVSYDKVLQAYLLDSKNSVLVIGDPTVSPELEKLYKNTISKYSK